MKRRVAVDSELVDEARRVGGHPMGAVTVEEALKESVRRRAQLRAADLFGAIDFDPDYDYKSARLRRSAIRSKSSGLE